MITVTHTDRYHHMPESSERPNLNGLTLRQALRKLRKVDFGDLGGVQVELSDQTFLQVVNVPANGGGSLIGVHQIVRESGQGRVAIYKMA
jgi:hypothetical protein